MSVSSEVSIGWTESAAEREDRVDVIRSAWAGGYAHIFTPSEIDGIFEGTLDGEGSWVSARARSAGTLGARRSGRLVALASLGLLHGGDAELAALYVRPDEQGRGLGTALWHRAIAEFRAAGCPRMQVWTLARSGARAFYEARGCRPFDEGTFTIGAHVEAVIGYTLDLALPSGSCDGASSPRR